MYTIAVVRRQYFSHESMQFFSRCLLVVYRGYSTVFLILNRLQHFSNARRIEPEEVYDPKFSFLAVSLVTAGCLLCNLIYPFIALRYAIVAALLVFLWTQRKSVIDMLMNMKV